MSDFIIYWREKPGVLGYEICYKIPATSTWTIAGQTSGTWFNIENLDSCQEYIFKVSTICDENSSPPYPSGEQSMMDNENC